MAQHKFVIIELQCEDEGTPGTGGGKLLPIEKWVWEDIFRGIDDQFKTHVLSVRVFDKGEYKGGFPNFAAYEEWRKAEDKRARKNK